MNARTVAAWCLLTSAVLRVFEFVAAAVVEYQPADRWLTFQIGTLAGLACLLFDRAETSEQRNDGQ